MAFKKLFPDFKIIKIDTNFVTAGNATDPLDFFMDLKTIKNGFTKIEIKQNSKFIAFCNLRFMEKIKTDDFLYDLNFSNFPDSIKNPEFYEPLKWIEERNSINDENDSNQVLFEIRPIKPEKFMFYEDAFEIARAWTRINPKIKS